MIYYSIFHYFHDFDFFVSMIVQEIFQLLPVLLGFKCQNAALIDGDASVFATFVV